jgi:hypothetical protein
MARLLDRHRDRLDEDVLPRLAGHDRGQSVPVVGRGVDDDVDRLVVEDPPKSVYVTASPPAASFPFSRFGA